MVSHLSFVEIPVVVFFAASTLTVKFVSCRLVLFFAIVSKFKDLDFSSVIDTQINPLASFTMKFTASGVIN